METIPEFTDGQWEGVLASYLPTVISARDKLIQLRYLHQMYYTPLRLYKMGRKEDPICHKCLRAEGSFIHMVWECDRVRPLWSQVTQFIADTLDIPNICSPLLGLLGIIEDEVMSNNMRTLLRLPFYYVRKLITLHWIRRDYLTLNAWKGLVNANITMYKITYESRGSNKKFNKVWGKWINSENTLHTVL